MAAPTIPPSEAAVGQALSLSARLREAPPLPGFTGFVRFSQGVGGHTFGDTCLSARSVSSRPGRDSFNSEAWTVPSSVQAASRILLRGHGPRSDLQDQHTREEQKHSMDTLLGVREKASSTLRDPMARRNTASRKVQPSFNPGGSTYRGHVDASVLEPAGSSSFCQSMDDMRVNNQRRVRADDIRKGDRLSVICR
eukprot:TRINITY_DN74371_c0_g1_i1.p1 TRINITY_DN74371_c0_g1~~TRINITY_DN74371_c0_g1_i1.p1  ORF type:complete len:195 (+),score=19.00 TRINITY_DN74371_c0_g1_i1:113-697(+)